MTVLTTVREEMTSDTFFESGTSLLTAEAFEFVLERELKRAVRAQNFLTLVLLEAVREWDGMQVSADFGTVQEMARIVSREVRDTDLLGHTGNGVLSLALLDADYERASRVVERLAARIENYKFAAAIRVGVAAACYPTHALDAGSLKRQAMARPLAQWCIAPPHASSTSNSNREA